jgi:hypothetical protein
MKKPKVSLRFRTSRTEASFLKEKVKQDYRSIEPDFVYKQPKVILKLREAQTVLKS